MPPLVDIYGTWFEKPAALSPGCLYLIVLRAFESVLPVTSLSLAAHLTVTSLSLTNSQTVVTVQQWLILSKPTMETSVP